MMYAMTVALRKPMTREEFFDWAQTQDGRFEFDGFGPVAMVGGTNNHGIITRNLLGQLYVRLRGKRCQSMPAEGGGVATTGNRVRYPEAAVTCSRVPGRERLLPDPVVVFEVISPSTQRVDQVLKLREYHAVPTIKRYVLIEQDGIAVTLHARQGDEPWVTRALVQDDILPLPEIGIEIPVAELYDGVVFDDAG